VKVVDRRADLWAGYWEFELDDTMVDLMED
jgi:hypothetical protein